MASLGYRFKHFVKKHGRWFTFAGAFIVVMTFIIKEGLGERWSSTARTIEKPHNTFTRFEQKSETVRPALMWIYSVS